MVQKFTPWEVNDHQFALEKKKDSYLLGGQSPIFCSLFGSTQETPQSSARIVPRLSLTHIPILTFDFSSAVNSHPKVMTENQPKGLELALKHRISARWQCVEQPHSCTIPTLIIKEMVDPWHEAPALSPHKSQP